MLLLQPSYRLQACTAGNASRYTLRVRLQSCYAFSATTTPSGPADCTPAAGCTLDSANCTRSCQWDILESAEAAFTVSPSGEYDPASLVVYLADSDVGTAAGGGASRSGGAAAKASLLQLMAYCAAQDARNSPGDAPQDATRADEQDGDSYNRVLQVFEMLASQAHQR